MYPWMIGVVNFLDLTITLNKDKHLFNIYRKPTFTDSLIPAYSNHPWIHKLSAFNSMIHRLLMVPLSKNDFQNELKIIYQIARNNGYNEQTITNLFKKKQNHKLLREFYSIYSTEQEKKKYTKISYFDEVTPNLIKIIKLDTIPAYKSQTNIAKLLSNAKDKIDTFEKSGVYKLQCDDCDAVYIGQTGRSFQTRVHEHFSHWQNNRLEKSNFSDHLLENKHNFDPILNTTILNLESKGSRLNSLEQQQINKAIAQNLNVVNANLITDNSPLLNLKL